ncbi:MAG: HAMP domain-containing histidine kinase [Defluviitaleaceae bacterium]|nr:HAMP domain-containing histidine kinase [Defluviitaleaceae bacterium]
MKRFKFILVRNFVGMVLLVLAIVYAAFNMITNRYITTEASRELARSVSSMEGIANHTAVVPPLSRHIQIMPRDEVFENIFVQWREVNPLRQLMLNTDGIIISGDNELVSPFINDDILFLGNYYVNNRSQFEDGAMVRLVGEQKAFYLTSAKLVLPEGTLYSILLYTDISSALLFMRNVNRTLGFLLIISAFVGLLISVIMSSRVQRAVLRLGRYAEVIGQGRFDEKVGDFEYREFGELAQSMSAMSHKLSTYENNQKQFFQNVSHELRTPLMSIKGYAEGITENVLDKDAAAYIILAEGERMEELVNQLLFISRMEGGLDELRVSSLNLHEILYDSAERVRILAEKNGKEITFGFPPAERAIVTDEEKLHRVLGNILTNAIRHAKLAIKIAYEDTHEGEVCISVENDGSLIAESDLPHIFERFYKGADGNSGLGLAICKDIAERLGGRVTAENTEHGVRFALYLPQAVL